MSPSTRARRMQGTNMILDFRKDMKNYIQNTCYQNLEAIKFFSDQPWK